VALSDPTNTQALDQIKFQSEASVEPVIVAHDALLALLAALSKSAEQSLNELAGDDADIEFAEDDAAAAAADGRSTKSRTRRSCAS
jgi:type IV pilus assembly protein PilB